MKLVDGKEVEVATLWTLYQVHLKDYDLDTVAEITPAPKELIEQLAKDIATIKPASIHQGEGINHWFHATEANRAAYLPLMLTGNIGTAGRRLPRLGRQLQGRAVPGLARWTGPGFKGWVAEDPFEHEPRPEGSRQRRSTPMPTPRTRSRLTGTTATARSSSTRRRTAARTFTGKTHMPTPTKALLFTTTST